MSSPTATEVPSGGSRESTRETGRSLLGIDGIEQPELDWLLERSLYYKSLPRERMRELLPGKTVVNLFFEASTRTRTSF